MNDMLHEVSHFISDVSLIIPTDHQRVSKLSLINTVEQLESHDLSHDSLLKRVKLSSLERKILHIQMAKLSNKLDYLIYQNLR